MWIKYTDWLKDINKLQQGHFSLYKMAIFNHGHMSPICKYLCKMLCQDGIYRNGPAAFLSTSIRHTSLYYGWHLLGKVSSAAAGDSFHKGFISSYMKFPVLILSLMIQSGYKFACVMTTELPWQLQNCDLIWSLLLKEEQQTVWKKK